MCFCHIKKNPKNIVQLHLDNIIYKFIKKLLLNHINKSNSLFTDFALIIGAMK